MTAAKVPKKTYQELESELQDILAWFESDSFDVDEAVKQYERGLELIKALEAHLGTAENTVRELKSRFDDTGAGKGGKAHKR
jgi:exodeoxyribonuclease VII small subunit